MKLWNQYIEESLIALGQAGVQNPAGDLNAIFAHAMPGVDPAALHEKPVNDNDAAFAAINTLVTRRLTREPMERILGYAIFHDLRLAMDDAVFKPGFETQATVDHGIRVLKDRSGPVRILDLGTGTGCILIALLKALPRATAVGIDRDETHIALAARNAAAHGVADRASFVISDWSAGVEGSFDLVISNPPRVPTRYVPELVKEVALYDPRVSVDGGKDGLEFYERTARDFRRLAAPDGVCIMQVGNLMAAQALKLFWRQGFRGAQFGRDYRAQINCVIAVNEPNAPSVIQRLQLLWRRVRRQNGS